jgi:predicted cupin superfamily sugar epimerase
MNAEAQELIARLRLKPLPHEGGFFRQTWVSAERLASGRAAGSAILFLLTADNFSALHRLETDELWHFCAGDAVEHVQFDPREPSVRRIRLGPDVPVDSAQLIVPGKVWQGARLAETAATAATPAPVARATVRRGWALMSCTLTPAWEEREFTLGRREELTRAFPDQAALIAALTR